MLSTTCVQFYQLLVGDIAFAIKETHTLTRKEKILGVAKVSIDDVINTSRMVYMHLKIDSMVAGLLHIQLLYSSAS